MKDKIREIMAVVFEVAPHDIADDSSPDTIDRWDSLNHMNLVTALEEELSIRFSDEEISEMLNLNLISHIVELKGR